MHILTLKLISQNYEINIGCHAHSSLINQKDTERNLTLDNSGFGLIFGAAYIYKFKKINNAIRVELVTELQKERINSHLGGGFFSSMQNRELEKYYLGTRLYPLVINNSKKLSFSIGNEVKYLVHENIRGEFSYTNGSTGGSGFYDSSHGKHGNNFQVNILGRIDYKIQFFDDWYFTPQYIFSLGLLNAFNEDNASHLAETKYLNHIISIGFIKG